MKVDDVLRYGTILTDDELCDRCDEMAAWVRIRIISYQTKIYYVKMINGSIEDFRRIDI